MDLSGIINNQYVSGLITGVAVSIAGVLSKWTIKWKKASKELSGNEGLWIEVIREGDQDDKPITYSLGEFKYDFARRAYFYNGDHYGPDGKIDSSWRSTPIEYDPRKKNLLYLYEVHRYNGNPTISHGFGFIDLQENASELHARYGYFVNAEDLAAVRGNVEYFRADKVAKDFLILPPDDEANRANLIKYLYENKWRGPKSPSA